MTSWALPQFLSLAQEVPSLSIEEAHRGHNPVNKLSGFVGIIGFCTGGRDANPSL